MAKSKAKKLVKKDLNLINQMKISKQIKKELLRCTKGNKNGSNRSMNRKKVLKKK